MDRKNFFDIIYSSDRNADLIITNNNLVLYTTKILQGDKNFLTIEIPKNVAFEYCKLQTTSDFHILNISKRTTYFDYNHYNSLYDIENIINSNEYKEKIKNIHAGIIFFITYNCTYNCPFCWQHNPLAEYKKQNKKQFEADILASSFNRLLPKYIYFTGGEPTLYRDLFLLMSKLDPSIKLRITSNFGPSFDIDKFIKYLAPERFESLSFSYHPSEVRQEDFLKKLDQIIKAGFKDIIIESVLYNDDIPRLKSMKSELKARGVTCKYDQCFTTDGTEHSISPENELTIQELKGATSEAEARNVVEQNGNIYANQDSLILCPAGHKSFHIDPLGDVYICMSALDRSKIFGKYALPHYSPIGNIQDKEFTYLEKPILCWEAFRCSACDYVVLQDYWHFLDREHPPLPE